MLTLYYSHWHQTTDSDLELPYVTPKEFGSNSKIEIKREDNLRNSNFGQ